jgi:hypothetical protein
MSQDVMPLKLDAPSNWVYFDGNDKLRISIYSQVASATVTISGRYLNNDKQFKPFREEIIIAATGAQAVVAKQLGAGWLVSLMASVTAGTVNSGDVLVKVELQDGSRTTDAPIAGLLFGSPDSFAPLVMGSPGEFSVDGRRARTLTKTLANPAANTFALWTCPSGVSWQLVAGAYEITTAVATGAARPTMSAYRADVDLIYEWFSTHVMGAGATWTVNWSTQNSAFSDITIANEEHEFPPLRLFPGDTLYYDMTGKVTNPQIDFCYLTVEETILGY